MTPMEQLVDPVDLVVGDAFEAPSPSGASKRRAIAAKTNAMV